MKYVHKAAPAAFLLFLAFATPAAAAPGPLESLLVAPFAITEALVTFAVSIPASLIDQPRRARSGAKARLQHAHHRKHRQPAYRFREPVEKL